MDYKEIIYDSSERIGTVTLNRPERLNAWTPRMEAEVRHAMTTAEHDPEVRVIVLTGSGRGFCAGMDMEILSTVSEEGLDGEADGSLRSMTQSLPSSNPGQSSAPREDFQFPQTYFPAIPKPVLAAVNGPAVGFGFIQTLYSDLRFASDTARFGTAFSRRGLIAEHGTSWILPRLIGLPNALDLCLSGRIIDADEALSMGLVSKVVSPEELLPTVRKYALDLAANCSPRSVAVIKKQLYNDQFHDLATANLFAQEAMRESIESNDFKEGVKSFMERRPPNFSGT